MHRKRGHSSSSGVVTTRDNYALMLSNTKAVAAARLLIPVTYAKRAELEEVVNYYDTYNNYTKGWYRWLHVNDEYNIRYKEMVEQGDKCRARLNILRSNKDTLYVSSQAQ